MVWKLCGIKKTYLYNVKKIVKLYEKTARTQNDDIYDKI